MRPEKTVQQWAKTISICALAVSMMLLCVGITKAQETTEGEIIISPTCARTIKADVVAFDQPFFYNRLGAVNPAGMIYALRRDVMPKSGTILAAGNRSEEHTSELQ